MKSTIDKLKFSINKNLVLKFNGHLLEQMKFVPISAKDGVVYVAVNPFVNKEEIGDFFKDEGFDVKFIQINEEEIEELLEYVS